MKGLRLQRWSGQLLSPRTRPCCIYQQIQLHASNLARIRCQSTASALHRESVDEVPRDDSNSWPSPPRSAARKSAKLAALHARLSLPASLPIETLARTLVDSSADADPDFNNSSLASVGSPILSYYVSEQLLCKYPRLPVSVLFASMYAYLGPPTLYMIAREWGVESAAAPGGEVDPGLLQFSKINPGEGIPNTYSAGSTRPNAVQKIKGQQVSNWRRGLSSKIVYDDEFGDLISKKGIQDPRTAQEAHVNFVKALVGAIYIHGGRLAAKEFIEGHILSRHLKMSTLFTFKEPTRDLARLCARQDFENPVARLLSETGRMSIAPVFVVGIYSGPDKLSEGAGSSLNEARTLAAVSALKSWYLYSPPTLRVPSEMEEEDARPWEPAHVDMGEVVV